MKVIIYLAILFCSYLHSSLHSTQEPTELVKLQYDQSRHTIPLPVIYKSITMLQKHLSKEKLRIEQKKPIVVHNVMSDEFNLFNDACEKTEETFISFFDGLSAEQQNQLISVAGKNKLNSPEITALLAQSCPIKDAISSYILSHHEKQKIKQYLQSFMIVDNIAFHSYFCENVLTGKTTFICPNGIPYTIPNNFTAHETFITPHITHPYLLCAPDNTNALITHMKKQISCSEYQLVSLCDYDQYGNVIHQNGKIIRTNSSNTQLIEEEIIGIDECIFAAICSFNGNYIALCSTAGTLLVLTLNHTSYPIIQQYRYLNNSYSRIIDMRFNNSSTKLIILAKDERMSLSELIIYDLIHQKENIINFATGSFIPLSFLDNDQHVIVPHHSMEYDQTLSVHTIHCSDNVSTIDNINITECLRTIQKSQPYYTISPYQYIIGTYSIPHSDTVLLQLCTNNMLFFTKQKNKDHFHLAINHLTQELFEVSLLCTPDLHFVISSAAVKNKNRILHPHRYHAFLSIWSTKTQSSIVSIPLPAIEMICKPLIILSQEGSSFITSCGNNKWIWHMLYAPDDCKLFQWLDANQEPFHLYMLWRLYKNHKNNRNAFLYTSQTLSAFLNSVPTYVQQCIKKHLM